MMDYTMNDTEQYGKRAAAERLAVLMSYRGRDRVREMLRVDDATLDGLLAGNLDWPEEARTRFQKALENLRRMGHPVVVDHEAHRGDAQETPTETGEEAESLQERALVVPDVAGPGENANYNDGPEHEERGGW